MLHAILNNRDLLGIDEQECTLGKFYRETKDLNAEDRGRALDESTAIGSVHNGLVAEGQSQQVEGDQKNSLVPCKATLAHLLRHTSITGAGLA